MFRTSLGIIASLVAATALAGERRLVDEGWRFHHGDVPGAESIAFDDSGWKSVDIPHDWEVHSPTSPDAPSAGAGGYVPAGVGWYRYELKIDRSKLRPHYPDARLRLEFDGVYRNAKIWLNGEPLGDHLYGYTPFAFDITDRVRYDGPNVVAVRVDNADQPNCRWYSGSGIYRHVWLRMNGPVAVEPASLWLRTKELKEDAAHAEACFSVTNTAGVEVDLAAHVTLLDAEGKVVAKKSQLLSSTPGGSAEQVVPLTVVDPELWSVDSPHLYTLSVELAAVSPSSELVVDTAEQRCGLRTLSFDAEQGMLLNGEPVVMFGGCVHHDHGPLGAASFDMAEHRKAKLLKEAGFNAIRTSHNPPAEAFLDACDELGLLVIDEAFDNWRKEKVEHDYGDSFDEIWRDDLGAMVRRDRHHPSVVMWSIGNEVYERGEESGFQYGRELSAFVREIDATRPVTAGICGLWGPGDWPILDPLFESLDVSGYNYEIARYASDHERLPERVVYGSETYPVDAFKSWKATTTQPWVVGDFVWTAMDYLGEASIGRAFPDGEKPMHHWEMDHYPWRGAACGDIDLLGRRKPISYYRNLVWERGDTLYMSVIEPAGEPWALTKWAFDPELDSWNWDVPEGTPLTVRVASRWPRVRVELNGRVVGEAATGEAEEFRADVSVPYEPGELVAIGLDEEGAEAERRTLTTAGPAERVTLEAEADTAPAGKQSIVYVDAEITDADGRVQVLGDREVRYSVEGPATLASVGNASLTTTEAYGGNAFPTFQGRGQVVLRSTGKPGAVTLTAEADGLAAEKITITFSK